MKRRVKAKQRLRLHYNPAKGGWCVSDKDNPNCYTGWFTKSQLAIYDAKYHLAVY